MNNIYDNKVFYDAYAQMSRSKEGLKAAGEWHQLKPLFPPLEGKSVLDLGCGYGWHSKYAADQGALSVLAFFGAARYQAVSHLNADINGFNQYRIYS